MVILIVQFAIPIMVRYFEMNINWTSQVALSGANLEKAAFEASEVSARQTNTVTWPTAAMAAWP